MAKLIRYFATVLMVGALTILSALPVAAHDEDTGHSTSPTEASGPTQGRSSGEDAYVGSSEEYHEGVVCTPSKTMDCPDHWSLHPHVHKVDRITGRYDGYFDNDLGRACIGPCTLAVTEMQQWANKWGATIGFSKTPVSGTVGYDVTYTSSQSFSYSFPVSRGQRKKVVKRDYHHVTNMNVRTEWISCDSIYCWTSSTTYGTAWAGRWYLREFRAVSY